MIVRDRTQPKVEYKGRPTHARDSECPCQPCFNAHDCGCYNVYMECATRYNNGCPNPLPIPQHVYTSERGRVCKRCGVRR